MQLKFLTRNLDMKQRGININLFEIQVMAILNVTPDSFYKNSRTFESVEIEERVKEIIFEGADIIDIGGYSSRPDADDVSLEEEWNRVKRALEVIRRLAPEMVVSIDTFRSEVAERAIEQFGEVIINDISAGEIDPRLMSVAAKYDVPYIAMHMRGTPQTMQQHTEYADVVEEVIGCFKHKINELQAVGVKRIVIDPGFGFAKDLDQNYSLMARLSQFKELGLPILVGVSRKSMIYKFLNTSAVDALAGTIALNWEALRQGASIIRVHDVKEAVESVKIFKKLCER